MNTIGQIIGKSSVIPLPGFEKLLMNSLCYIKSVSDFNRKMNQYQSLGLIPAEGSASSLMGVEIEVEKVFASLPLPSFIISKIDGSLRNRGREFITSPLNTRNTMESLILLWILLDKTNKGVISDFSWRTSSHVHINVIDLTEEQFKVFLLLGIIFERFLFKMAGEYRRDSVFCVPISDSFLIDPLGRYIVGDCSLVRLIQIWPKYSAMNLSRLIQSEGNPILGTVEFRHFPGRKTLDPLFLWLSVLNQLYLFALACPLRVLYSEISDLNSRSEYAQFLSLVLSDKTLQIIQPSDLTHTFSPAISLAKRLFFKFPKISVSNKSSLATIIRKDLKKRNEQEKRILNRMEESIF